MRQAGRQRSGCARVPAAGALPAALGESADALAHDEGVAAYHSAHMVVLTWKRPAFVVVELQLSFELLVHPLCLAPLLNGSNALLVATVDPQ